MACNDRVMAKILPIDAPELRQQANLYRRLAAVASREIASGLRRLAAELERRADRLERGGH